MGTSQSGGFEAEAAKLSKDEVLELRWAEPLARPRVEWQHAEGQRP